MRLCALLILSLATTAFAEGPFDFESTPGKLPKDVVPKRYTVRVEPEIEAATFRGRETIEIEVRRPVRQLVLNTNELEITRAQLGDTPLTPQVDAGRQTLTFPLAEELPAGTHRLEIEFAGKLNEKPAGLFLTRYRVGAEEKRGLATQMEPADARRMFPCWDEPVFRAAFELTVVIPAGLTPVSNMPIAAEQPLEGGRKEVHFAATPSMSTYLLALFVAEFDVIEDEVEGVKLRALTTPGRAEQARYALEATKKILPFYREYFGTSYPLPKLDQISLPSTGAGGMENWGAILYADTAFLYDPATSSGQTRERVFEVVAHELAHQWFGNLVTMAWWDNLWLNEGFASWMGTKATDHFNPEWQTWLRAAGAKEWAMALDARATTHPVQQKVATEDQAMDAFDVITYQKGQAFIRMLENYLGETSFRGGIRSYLKKHVYSSTTTADLWAALEESSGKAVRALAAGWTEQPGFPVVTVEEVAGPAVLIAQERFTLGQENPEPLFWAVPIALGPAAAPLDARMVLLKEKSLPPQPIEPGQALKANVGGVGYYRVRYDDALFKRLHKATPLMAVADRLNLLDDAWAMAAAGRAPIGRFFDLAETLGEDTSYVIAARIMDACWDIDKLQRGEPGAAAFHAWARRAVRPHFERLGWDARPEEKPLDAKLRAELITQLGAFGDPKVIAEAQRRFRLFVGKGTPLAGDLRRAVLGIAGREANAETWEKLHELLKAETSTELKHEYQSALAAVREATLSRRALALSITGELLPEDSLNLVEDVASLGQQPAAAIEFAQANLAQLLAEAPPFDGNSFLPRLYRRFTDAGRAAELETYALAHPAAGSAPQVAKAADEIRLNATLKKRLLPDIDARCRAQPGK